MSDLNSALLNWLAAVMQAVDTNGVYQGEVPNIPGEPRRCIAVWLDEPLWNSDEKHEALCNRYRQVYDSGREI